MKTTLAKKILLTNLYMALKRILQCIRLYTEKAFIVSLSLPFFYFILFFVGQRLI